MKQIENYDDSSASHNTRAAERQDDVGSDEEHRMHASCAVAMKAVKDTRTKAKAISLTSLDDLTSKLAEAGDESDEDGSCSDDDGPWFGIGGSLLMESLGMFKGPTTAPKAVTGGRPIIMKGFRFRRLGFKFDAVLRRVGSILRCQR